MEKDKNPIPQIDLFPKLTKIGRALGRLLTPRPTEAPDFMSNHYRGAAEMLDANLYGQVNVEGFLYDGRDE